MEGRRREGRKKENASCKVGDTFSHNRQKTRSNGNVLK
jgi:hypothetical protein